MQISDYTLKAIAAQVAHEKLRPADGWSLGEGALANDSEGEATSDLPTGDFTVTFRGSRYINEFNPMSTEDQPQEFREVSVYFSTSGFSSVVFPAEQTTK